ncbi:hypothetical protein VNO80_25718 [Phaseolus coccineus]|uniref:Uncharacterized protein n=1 Tax=Phaseolus coccineus TaxID=3886 RepID=A0AAN9LV55_PHACN
MWEGSYTELWCVKVLRSAKLFVRRLFKQRVATKVVHVSCCNKHFVGCDIWSLSICNWNMGQVLGVCPSTHAVSVASQLCSGLVQQQEVKGLSSPEYGRGEVSTAVTAITACCSRGSCADVLSGSMLYIMEPFEVECCRAMKFCMAAASICVVKAEMEARLFILQREFLQVQARNTCSCYPYRVLGITA